MKRPDLVIFDCDGVLVDSEPLSNAILETDLAMRGLPLSQSEIARLFVGGTMRGVGEQAAEMGADIPDDWVDKIYAKIYARLAEGTPLIDGVEPLMDRLDAAGIRYCVGSNGSDEKMRITLGQHPQIMRRLQGKLYSAHTYSVAKPDPELFLIAARDHEVQPENCLVIDDSPPGCIAARRAAMRCFGLAEHDDGERLAAQKAEVISSLREVPDLLSI